jgi:hypothetical protein
MIVVHKRAASVLVCLSLLAGFASLARPQDSDAGQQEFLKNCAECHGADGKGGGPRGAKLGAKPADLTRLAKNNHGVFDAAAVYQIIDGRKSGSRAHLSKDMPVWGCRHPSSPPPPRRLRKHRRYLPPPVLHKHDEDTSIESFVDLSCDSEAAIQARILSIVGYLSGIQAR